MCGLPTGRAFWSAPFSRCYACGPIAVSNATSDFCAAIRLTRAYKSKTRVPAINRENLPCLPQGLNFREAQATSAIALAFIRTTQDLFLLLCVLSALLSIFALSSQRVE